MSAAGAARLPWRRRVADGELTSAEAVAAVLDRLAMLLAGGAAPATAWALLARHAGGLGDAAAGSHGGPRGDAGPVGSRVPASAAGSAEIARAVARALDEGRDATLVLAARPEPGWRALGCAWTLAIRTGAPLARALGGLAGGFRDVGAAERDVRVALAGPAATSRIVLALPLVGLGLGLAMGADTLGVLTTTPFGLVCLAVGAALMASGWWWMRALVRRASCRDPHPGLALDLVALGMLGGSAAGEVAATVSAVMRRFDLHDGAAATIAPTLRLAAEAGVPPAELLRREAVLARVVARAAGQRRAAELGVGLMLPLGVCVLPAFIALGVAPLVLAILGDVLRPLAG